MIRRFARLTPVDSGALLLITVVTLYVGTTNGHYSYDDAYITYRMADNFSRGLGFVYNPGEWHLGSTAAFYGLLVGSVRWLLSAISPNGAPPIPAIGGLISALSLLATGWMLYGLGRNARAPLCGLAAGLFYITNPMIFVTFGGELPFQIALITGAFFAHQQGARPIAAALAALAILTRPDGVQAAGVLLVYDIASRWNNTKGSKGWKTLVPWRELLTAAIILTPFIGAAWYAYGSPLPSTMAAKMAQRDSGLWGTYGRGLVDWVLLFLWNDKAPNLGFAPVNPPLVWLWALLGLAGIWRYRVFLPLVAWSAVFVLSYTALRVPFYHWYAAPAAFGISILAGCGLCAVAELVEKWWTARGASPAAQVEGRKQAERVERVEKAKAAKDAKAAEVIGTTALNRPALIVSLAALLLVAAAAVKPLLALPRTSQLNPTVRLYIEVGEWLQVNTMPEASVGYYEIGYIGFYGRRRMIDTLGLIDPEVSPAVARRDFTWALRVRRPDFILEKRGAGLNGFLGEQWFKDEYRSRAIMSVRGPSTEGVIIHERIATPAAAPAPVPVK